MVFLSVAYITDWYIKDLIIFITYNILIKYFCLEWKPVQSIAIDNNVYNINKVSFNPKYENKNLTSLLTQSYTIGKRLTYFYRTSRRDKPCSY